MQHYPDLKIFPIPHTPFLTLYPRMFNRLIFTLYTIILCLVNLIKPSSITQQKNCGFIINPQFFIYKIHTFNYKIQQPYYPHTNRQFSKFFHTTSFQHEEPLPMCHCTLPADISSSSFYH